MSGSILSLGMMFAGVFDMGLGALAYLDVPTLAKLCPFWISSDEKFVRLVGCFMFLCGIARFHGGLNITEKGAYRVSLWSFVVEAAFHALEVYKGTFTLAETKPVFIICGGAIAVLTMNYRRCLYPEGGKKGK